MAVAPSSTAEPSGGHPRTSRRGYARADTTTERIPFISGPRLDFARPAVVAPVQRGARSVLVVIGGGPYGDRHGGQGHRKGNRDGGRRAAPRFLDEQHARGHVPAVGARLAPRRVGGSHVRGLPRGAAHLARPRSTLSRSPFSSTTPAGSNGRRASSSTSASSRPWAWTATQASGDLASGHRFRVRLDDGAELVADAVVAAPGVGYFRNMPDWSAGLPDGLCSHTCDLVRFHDFAGARVLIVGGRQSAYEWAALIGEAGAEQVDIVHRHEVPRFERVSWRFADEYVERIVASPGWWRSLPASEQEAIARKFWEVGRLTLEWWLTPRLQGKRFRRRPGTSVVAASTDGAGAVRVQLSDGTELGRRPHRPRHRVQGRPRPRPLPHRGTAARRHR